MEATDSQPKEDDSLESFINLSHSLYEESNIKGLDYALLHKNRERIEQEQKAAECRNELASAENEAVAPMAAPAAFATAMAKQIFELIASSKNRLFEDKREHFARDRMVFEFDTAHDFVGARFYEHIPTKIFRSAEDCEAQEKTLKLDMGSIELTKRAKESFANTSSSNSDFARLANWGGTSEDGVKIGNAQKLNRGIHIEKSDSEDIFDDAGAYVFQPITQPIAPPTAQSNTLTEKQQNRTETHTEKHKKSVRRKKSKKSNENPNEKSVKKSHRRNPRRHSSPRPKNRSKNRSKSRSKSGPKSRKRRRRRRSEKASPRYSKRRRRSERAAPQGVPQPRPAEVLASETRRNWAPRADVSIYQRAKAEFGGAAAVAAEGGVGLGRALRDAADPYSAETRVEAFGKSALVGEEGNKKTSGFRKYGGRKKGSKGSKKNTKFDSQWKKIQERLG